MEFIKGVPKLNSSLSYNTLKLTPIEGYLLSRVDGVSSVDDLASLSGLPYDQALEVIKGLWNKKVFLIDGLEPAGNKENNDVDLSEDEKSAIEKMTDTVKNGTFYQILSVPLQVKPDQVKAKFFELSKIYHPDRYFKKNIGDYKVKLNAIFKKLSEAYEVLYDPQKKQWYDAALVNANTPASRTQRAAPPDNTGARTIKSVNTEETAEYQKPPRITSAQSVRREETIKSANTEETVKFQEPPFVEPMQSVQSEETVKIENPRSLESALEQKIALMKERLDKNMLQQVLGEMAALKDVRDSRIPLLMAHYYLKHNDLLNARDYTQMAIEYDANNVRAYELLGEIYMKFKLYRNALKVYETIKNIKPADSHAETMIQEIKSLIED